MTEGEIVSILEIGEGIAVEFKRCGNGIGADVFETVCSFLNRFGGDIFLGILDDGTVEGVADAAVSDIMKNFIKMIGNPDVISPTIYLAPEKVTYEGKNVIHIHVPPSSEVHRCKKVIYDRVEDADVKVTSTGQIAAMYIRKQNIFTEKKIYPYVTKGHLRLDLLPICRKRALNKRQDHPWKDMDDDELLRSAGLYGEDFATGEKGFNLAAIMLLGKDEVIQSVCPVYKTDAILRKVNKDRYDDREIIKTNLIESYDNLMKFAKKHLWDKFYLEDNFNVSLRDKIAREMLANTLIHREYTSSYIAKFIIEEKKMYVENACRAVREGKITPENLNPAPKNPLIASFFNQIGNADELGSGTRNLYKYSMRYSGAEPWIVEGDIFRITVPLDDNYSFDAKSLSYCEERGGDGVREEIRVNSDKVKENFEGKIGKEAENRVGEKAEGKAGERAEDKVGVGSEGTAGKEAEKRGGERTEEKAGKAVENRVGERFEETSGKAVENSVRERAEEKSRKESENRVGERAEEKSREAAKKRAGNKVEEKDENRARDKAKEKVGDKVSHHKRTALTQNQMRIIAYLRQDPGLSAVELSKKVGISSRKIESNIKKLKEKGLLRREGSARKGYWIVIEACGSGQ